MTPVDLGQVDEAVLPYEQVGFLPGGPEHVAVGPDRIAGGPDGLCAIYSPVTRQVLVLDDLMVVDAFPVGIVDDFAFTKDGDLALLGSDRTLRLLSRWGESRDALPLRELVPTGVSLAVLGSEIVGLDVFGNVHPLATVADGDLGPVTGPAIRPPLHTLKIDGGSISVDSTSFSALKSSTRVLDSGGTSWLIVEAVVSDHPIRVERFATSGNTRIDLPVDDRLYAPARDLAVDFDGRLLVLEPRANGLGITRVSP